MHITLQFILSHTLILFLLRQNKYYYYLKQKNKKIKNNERFVSIKIHAIEYLKFSN